MSNQQTQEKFKTTIGGQALIEGIMMRGPEKDAIAIRTKDIALYFLTALQTYVFFQIPDLSRV